jgi:F-type H+-transporting ATPase subunit b
MLNLIADQAWNPFAPFGVTSWEPFVANLIAFILMVVILRYLAFKPIQNVLEKRRQRIEEGEEMREESERQLASVKEQTHEMLVEAGEKGQEKIDAKPPRLPPPACWKNRKRKPPGRLRKS